MSFNNWIDTEAAWSLVNDFERPAAAVVKHSNPCGAAVGSSVAEALGRAWESDSPAAFGGVVAMNRPLDRATAEFLAGVFVEVVVVPQVNDGSPLTTKANLRLLEASPPHRADLDLRRLEDGFLAQTRDRSGAEDWNVVTSHQPTDQQWEDLLFAWVVASHTKSNAIALAKGLASVGIGAGDQSRVGAVQRAVSIAGSRAEGAVAASDAFFPFRDGIDALAAAGVEAVVQPGGSRRDEEVIAAAEEHGIALVFTGRRHFRH
jgi:phosphoribosylaminoimidazolecarboxamide formyltransferase/IMP cyclohydrolase